MRRKLRGKLPPDMLAKEIFEKLPTAGEGVLLGPALGEDAAVLKVEDDLLVIHSDPVTGGGRLAGWLSVCVASNDIATRGVRPKWLLTVFLFREGVTRDEMRDLVEQVGNAAREIGAVVVGGHTEITPGLPFNIIVTTALGTGSKVINTRDAREGDLLVVTKDIALEGTAILASELSGKLRELGVDEETLRSARNFIREISVVKEALISSENGLAMAMHDPTEGGLLGGIQEVAMASGTGFRIYEEKVPLRRETKAICDALSIDPLRLISSGSLLISVARNDASILIERLRESGVKATIIGELTPRSDGMTLIREDGREEDVSEPVIDELWRILSE